MIRQAAAEFNCMSIASFLDRGGSKMGDEKKDQPILEWKCSNCGYTLEAPAPPDQCPSCKEYCEFLNVTCYIPDCGAPGGGGSDPRLG